MMIKEMRVILFAAAVILAVVSVANAQVVVVDFDDLDYKTTLSGTTYAGLTWEWGNLGYEYNQGYWKVPSDLPASYPYSEPHNVINAWGATLMGISFPETVNVQGAYFAAQGDTSSWTTGVRIHGYLSGAEVEVTNWFNDIDETPSWFAMNLENVDRIVVESVAVDNGGGWYAMDDFTYVPEPATFLLLSLGGLLLRRRRA